MRHAREDPTAVLPRQLRYPLKFRCDVSRAQCPGHLSLLRFCFPIAPFPPPSPVECWFPGFGTVGTDGRPSDSCIVVLPRFGDPNARQYLAMCSLFAPRGARARRTAGLGLVTRDPRPTCPREERRRSPRFLEDLLAGMPCAMDPGGAAAPWSSVLLVSPTAVKRASASSCLLSSGLNPARPAVLAVYAFAARVAPRPRKTSSFSGADQASGPGLVTRRVPFEGFLHLLLSKCFLLPGFACSATSLKLSATLLEARRSCRARSRSCASIATAVSLSPRSTSIIVS